jgi:hypothetical protein
MVLYKALYKSDFGENTLWVRSREMFLQEVEADGKKVQRFQFIE